MTVPARACLRCDRNLDAEVGVQVFVSVPPPAEVRYVPGLLCLTHGANGHNTLTRAEYDQLVQLRQS